MNKQNMQRLIDAIKFDGQKKFNMSLFIGKLEGSYEIREVFEHGQIASKYKPTRVTYIEEGTSMFNCTSMGCIAGFASALANDWKAPNWLSEDDASEHVSMFEKEANEFLGLTQAQGRNLYFADMSSIWKWLQYVESDRYCDLSLEEYESLDHALGDADMCWDDQDLYADFNSIDYLTAVDVLTRIMNEEIGLANNDGEPYYIKKEALVS